MIKCISNLINKISSINIVKGKISCNKKNLIKNIKMAVPALSISLFAGTLVCLNSQNLNSLESDATSADVRVAATSNDNFSFIPKFFDATSSTSIQTSGDVDDISSNLVEGYGLYIDGKLVGVALNEEKIDEMLNSIIYSNNIDGGVASFVENVEKTAGLYKMSDIKTNDEIKEFLNNPSVEMIRYTVQNGDTPISIARKFDMSLDQLNEINGGDINPLMIAGDEINVVECKFPVNVKVSKIDKKEKEIKYSQIIKYDNKTEKGISYIQQNGRNGKEVETEKVEYINGKEVNRSFVNKEITEKPVNEVTIIGTKEKPKKVVLPVKTVKKPVLKKQTPVKPTEIIKKASKDETVTNKNSSNEIIEGTSKKNKKANKKKNNKNKKSDNKKVISKNNNNKNKEVTPKTNGNGKTTGKFAWPVKYTHNITSGYGPRWGTFHKGIDIAQGGIYGKGIYASDGGYVESATHSKLGYGNCVVINHGNGYKTRYAHCSKLLVKKGQKISKSQEIARVGSTGDSTGPHVHYEIIHNGSHVNPLNYVK